MNNILFDLKKYKSLLKAVGAMSRLYSKNAAPFFHSRFIEKLYVASSKGIDLGRADMSFDAIVQNKIGVGIKTFSVSNFQAVKAEKIAELTSHATAGLFKNLSNEELANKSACIRNLKVRSDANEFGIDLNRSIYHCLVRSKNGQAMIHEEPYPLIDIKSIRPNHRNGTEIKQFSKQQLGNTYFSDGRNKYIYNIAKNVLFKRFDLNLHNNSKAINIEVYDDILDKVLLWYSQNDRNVDMNNSLQDAFVILPLYGYKDKQKYIYPSSGLNQWNASGRKRVFGESYIPIPRKIHEKNPDFFPPRDQKFDLLLPNQKKVEAKVCQDGSKALMADPNIDLLSWLYKLIDGDIGISEKRLANKKPFIYDDLAMVGKDSVKITKKSDATFNLSMMPLNSYELFINDILEDEIDKN